MLLFESAPGVIHTYNQAKSRETINNVKNSDRKGQGRSDIPSSISNFLYIFFKIEVFAEMLIQKYLNFLQIYAGNSIV